MNSFKRIMPGLFLVITALLLGACGGSGGGSDASIAVPIAPSTPVTINAANAELVSADVLYSAELIGGFSLVGSLLPSVQVDINSSKFNYPDFFIQQLQKFSALSILSNDVNVSGIVITGSPQTYDCAVSGTSTVYGNVSVGAPEWIPTEGDQITIRFNDCEDLDGLVLNGEISIYINSLDDTSDPIVMNIQVVMTVLSVDLGGDAFNADGDMQMILSKFESGDEQIHLGGEELTVWAGSEVETFKGYAYDVFEKYTGVDPGNPENPENYNYTYLMEGTLDSTVTGGSVSFLMTDLGNEFKGDGVPFLVYPDYYPYAGDLSITSSADASDDLKISVENVSSIMINLYSGEMPTGDTIMTDWLHLENCLLDPGICYLPM
jgi:hypothetical protein